MQARGTFTNRKNLSFIIYPCLNSLESLLHAVLRHHVNKEITNFTRTKSSYLPPTLPHTLPATLGQGRLKKNSLAPALKGWKCPRICRRGGRGEGLVVAGKIDPCINIITSIVSHCSIAYLERYFCNFVIFVTNLMKTGIRQS